MTDSEGFATAILLTPDVTEIHVWVRCDFPSPSLSLSTVSHWYLFALKGVLWPLSEQEDKHWEEIRKDDKDRLTWMASLPCVCEHASWGLTVWWRYAHTRPDGSWRCRHCVDVGVHAAWWEGSKFFFIYSIIIFLYSIGYGTRAKIKCKRKNRLLFAVPQGWQKIVKLGTAVNHRRGWQRVDHETILMEILGR